MEDSAWNVFLPVTSVPTKPTASLVPTIIFSTPLATPLAPSTISPIKHYSFALLAQLSASLVLQSIPALPAPRAVSSLVNVPQCVPQPLFSLRQSTVPVPVYPACTLAVPVKTLVSVSVVLTATSSVGAV